MALAKTLDTGSKIRTWNYDDSNTKGQTVSIKNSNGDYEPIIHIESVKCSEGIVDRVVIKKSVLEKAGWLIVED